MVSQHGLCGSDRLHLKFAKDDSVVHGAWIAAFFTPAPWLGNLQNQRVGEPPCTFWHMTKHAVSRCGRDIFESSVPSPLLVGTVRPHMEYPETDAKLLCRNGL